MAGNMLGVSIESHAPNLGAAILEFFMGFIFFPWLFTAFDKFAKRFMAARFKLKDSQRLDIANKMVSAFFAVLTCAVGFAGKKEKVYQLKKQRVIKKQQIGKTGES